MGTYRTMNVCDLDYSDFTVISPLVGDPKVLVVGKDSKYNTLQELLDAIKENPGKITMSHSGPGGSGHNQGLVLKELGYEVAMTSFDSGNDALLGVIGGQVDFIRGAAYSKGGRAILAFPATAKGGTISKIVPFLTEGSPVTTSRCDVDYIVTEYGIAKMKGRTLRERARQLIGLAAPQFRDDLAVEFEKRFAEKY